MMKRLIYFEPSGEDSSHSQETMLTRSLSLGTMYLVDEDQDITTLWGDDWNDSPSDCNSGPPYAHKCKGLITRELKLGDLLE
jgi:hypothetical protein